MRAQVELLSTLFEMWDFYSVAPSPPAARLTSGKRIKRLTTTERPEVTFTED
jgi:hypothetical protein